MLQIIPTKRRNDDYSLWKWRMIACSMSKFLLIKIRRICVQCEKYLCYLSSFVHVFVVCMYVCMKEDFYSLSEVFY